jgi:hypothetical protein
VMRLLYAFRSQFASLVGVYGFRPTLASSSPTRRRKVELSAARLGPQGQDTEETLWTLATAGSSP